MGMEGKEDFGLRISDFENKKSFIGNAVSKICWKGLGLDSRESQTWEERKRQKMVYKGFLILGFIRDKKDHA